MANCLFDRRKVGPKPLRPKVQLGPVLTMRQRMNEVPPLISFERQTPSSAGMQHRTPTPLTRPTQVKVNLTCCIAKADHYGGEMAEVYRQRFKTGAKAKIPVISMLMRA
jgi:hypothetical protein